MKSILAFPQCMQGLESGRREMLSLWKELHQAYMVYTALLLHVACCICETCCVLAVAQSPSTLVWTIKRVFAV